MLWRDDMRYHKEVYIIYKDVRRRFRACAPGRRDSGEGVRRLSFLLKHIVFRQNVLADKYFVLSLAEEIMPKI